MKIERSDLKALNEFVEVKLNNVNVKKDEMKKLVVNAIADSIRTSLDWLTRAFETYEEVTRLQVKALEETGYCEVVEVTAKLVSEGIVGTSSGPFNSIFEVGLSIDPLLGLPYYPGSGVKGAVRATFEELLETECNLDPSKTEFISNMVFGIAGKESWISSVTFLDAYPIGCDNCSIFEKVLINPHYFEGGKPVDTELDVVPVPIQFIGISPGTIFKFVFGIKETDQLREACRELNELSGGCECNEPCTSIAHLVAKSFLKTLVRGLAAKAAKGYNVFDLVGAKHVPKNISIWKERETIESRSSVPSRKSRSSRGFRRRFHVR